MEGGDISPSSPPTSPLARMRKYALVCTLYQTNNLYSPQSGADSREMGLDLIVGRLLNSGNMTKAEAICMISGSIWYKVNFCSLGKQFNYTPREFEIAKTITGIAEKTIDANIANFSASKWMYSLCIVNLLYNRCGCHVKAKIFCTGIKCN